MVEHLRVIKEGHFDVKWEPKPTPRQDILERLHTIKESHLNDNWELTSAPRQRLSLRLKKDPTPDPLPSPPTERCFLQCLASVRPNVIAHSPAT